MYCTYCGHQNPEGSKFCESCGKLISEQVPLPTPPPGPILKLGWLKRLTSIGGVIVILCFFMPWILVSCSAIGMKSGITASGYEIASGHYSFLNQVNQLNQMGGLFGSNAPYGSDTSAASGVTGYPLVFGIVVLGVLGLISLNGHKSGSDAAIMSGAMGAVGLIIFTILLNQKLGSQINQYGLGVFHFSYQIGYWGAWFGFLWLLIAGILTQRQQK
jgi:hypothetical protein